MHQKTWGFGFGLMTKSVPQMNKDSWEAKHYMVKIWELFFFCFSPPCTYIVEQVYIVFSSGFHCCCSTNYTEDLFSSCSVYKFKLISTIMALLPLCLCEQFYYDLQRLDQLERVDKIHVYASVRDGCKTILGVLGDRMLTAPLLVLWQALVAVLEFVHPPFPPAWDATQGMRCVPPPWQCGDCFECRPLNALLVCHDRLPVMRQVELMAALLEELKPFLRDHEELSDWFKVCTETVQDISSVFDVYVELSQEQTS